MRADHPLVNLRTLQVTTFRAAVGSGSLFWASVTGVPFLLTLLFQNVFGWSPVKSGAIVAVRVGRQHRDQTGDHAAAAPLRVPAGARRRHRRRGGRRWSSPGCSPRPRRW
jgi:hypothetical protein